MNESERGGARRALLGAIALALVIAGVFFVTQNVRKGQPEPRSVRFLLNSVPSSFNETCVETDFPKGSLASIKCSPDFGAQNGVTYTVFDTTSKMRESYLARLTELGVTDSSQEPQPEPCSVLETNTPYYYDSGKAAGNVACVGEPDTIVVWTSEATRIIGEITGAGNKPVSVGKFWKKAGPTLNG